MNGLSIFTALLFEVGKNFSQSFCFSKRQVRFYSCLILKEITEFLLSKIGMYLLDFLRFFRISGEEVTVGLLGCD